MLVFCLFLLMLQSSNIVAVNEGTVKGRFYNGNDTALLAQTNDDLPANLKENFHFENQKLAVHGPINQSLNFVIVYSGLLNPLFEWCYTDALKNFNMVVCFNNFNSSCPDNSKIVFVKSHVNFYLEFFNKQETPAIQINECIHVLRKTDGTIDGVVLSQNGPLSNPFPGHILADISGPAYPHNASLTQTSIKLEGSICGTINFPNAMLAYEQSANETFINETSSSTTTLGPISNIVKTTTSTASNAMIYGIIGGVLGGILLIVIIIVIIICCRRRKKKSKGKAKAPPPPIDKYKPTKSMESVAVPLPKAAPVPKAATGLKTASTQKTVTVDVAATAKLPVQPPQKLNHDPMRTAEEKTKVPSDELSLLQVAFPKMEVDPSQPYSKIFYCDYFRNEATINPKPKYSLSKSIVPFLTEKIDDMNVGTSLYTPDCLIQQALREPQTIDRAEKFYQAIILANNLLYDLGFRRKIFHRSPDTPLEYYVTGPPKSEEWLKKVNEGEFLRFLVSSAQKEISGKDGEFEEIPKLWRLYLDKIDVPETFRQACIIGQSHKRRQFFVMATYLKMSLLMSHTPEENVLQIMPYPIPMLLSVVHDAPHYFNIDETATVDSSVIIVSQN